MDDWVLRIPLPAGRGQASGRRCSTHEWLVTNGLGGYASGHRRRRCARRYHGLLIAALPAPLGRSDAQPPVRTDPPARWRRPSVRRRGMRGRRAGTARGRVSHRVPPGSRPAGVALRGRRIRLREARAAAASAEHRLRQLSPGGRRRTVRLKLRPSVHFRAHDAPVGQRPRRAIRRSPASSDRYELNAEGRAAAAAHVHARRAHGLHAGRQADCREVLYRVEESRGYDARRATLWSPGYFRVDLTRDQDATLVASTESWETMLALQPDEAFQRRARAPRAAAARPRARRCRTSRAANWSWPPISSSSRPAGRVEDAARARPPATRCAP